MKESIKCPRCKSKKYIKANFKSKDKSQYRCSDCSCEYDLKIISTNYIKNYFIESKDGKLKMKIIKF